MPKNKPAPKPAPAKRAKPGTNKEAAASRKKVFTEAYIANGGNATQAAITAGYSEATARQQGSRLLTDVDVQVALTARQEKLAAKFELTTEAVLKNLAQAIFFDPRKLYREDGSLKNVTELDDDTAMALAGFEVTEEKETVDGHRQVVGFTKKVKWLDRNTAREQAMKHLGQYREDNSQRNPLAEVPREALKALVDRLKA
jgi:phage terminase small subunit